MERESKKKVECLIQSFKGKKGNAIIDTLVIIVIMFIIAIFVVSFWKGVKPVQEDLMAEFNESGYNQSARAIAVTHDVYPSFWDGAFVFIFFGLWLSAIISAFLVDSHPIFFFIMIIILVPILVVGMVLGNTYEEYMNDSEYSTYKSSFPMTYWIMTHMLPITIIVGVSIGISLYAKDKI